MMRQPSGVLRASETAVPKPKVEKGEIGKQLRPQEADLSDNREKARGFHEKSEAGSSAVGALKLAGVLVGMSTW